MMHCTWRDIDDMLVTDTWEAMEYMAVEPPTHVLLAAFLGYKAQRKPTPGNNPSEAEVSSALTGLVKEKTPAPEWMRNSPSLQKLFADMKGQPNAL